MGGWDSLRSSFAPRKISRCHERLTDKHLSKHTVKKNGFVLTIFGALIAFLVDRTQSVSVVLSRSQNERWCPLNAPNWRAGIFHAFLTNTYWVKSACVPSLRTRKGVSYKLKEENQRPKVFALSRS